MVKVEAVSCERSSSTVVLVILEHSIAAIMVAATCTICFSKNQKLYIHVEMNFGEDMILEDDGRRIMAVDCRPSE
jgi:hypothetical protein